jgi:hypothetical protein
MYPSLPDFTRRAALARGLRVGGGNHPGPASTRGVPVTFRCRPAPGRSEADIPVGGRARPVAHKHAAERAGVEARRHDSAGTRQLEVVEVRLDDELVTLVVRPKPLERRVPGQI